MTTRVLVVRHGQTYGNIEGRFCGHSETELTPLGVAQARALGRRLRGQTIDMAFTSDLSRAADTARWALEHHAVAPSKHPGLREMHYGEWEAQKGADIGKSHPELLRDFFLGKAAAAPGGETVQGLRGRTVAALMEAVEAGRGGTVLVVSHGNAIMAMLAELMRLPIEATWSFQCDNASLTRLQFSNSGRFLLQSYNDATHTEGLAEAGA